MKSKTRISHYTTKNIHINKFTSASIQDKNKTAKKIETVKVDLHNPIKSIISTHKIKSNSTSQNLPKYIGKEQKIFFQQYRKEASYAKNPVPSYSQIIAETIAHEVKIFKQITQQTSNRNKKSQTKINPVKCVLKTNSASKNINLDLGGNIPRIWNKS